MPPSLQIASWVADGISYVVTQKSLTDHGISFLAQRDCALWRGVKGEAICRDPDVGTFAVASGSNGGKTPGIKRGGKTPDEPFAVPVRAAPWVTAVVAGQRRRGRAPKAIRAEPVAGSGFFYVIGSFRRFDLAEALAKRYGGLNARLVDASLHGSRLYRVVVGPFDQGRQDSVYRRIAKAGIDDAWATLMTLPANRRTAQAPLFHDAS